MKILINALLIIIIISLLLENIDYKVSFGTKKSTNVTRVAPSGYDTHTTNNLDITGGTLTSPRDELLNYISSTYKSPVASKEHFNNPPNNAPPIQKNIPMSSSTEIKPGNYYIDNNNTPNFSSNVSELSKFYDIITPEDQSSKPAQYDYIKSNAALTSGSNSNSVSTPNVSKPNVSSNNYKPPSTPSADSWVYSNELPMNGGQLGGISGFDTLESSYALYGNSSSSAGCNIQLLNKDDDLRMGLGTPNTSNRNEGI